VAGRRDKIENEDEKEKGRRRIVKSVQRKRTERHM
jgi:hypothetical protein